MNTRNSLRIKLRLLQSAKHRKQLTPPRFESMNLYQLLSLTNTKRALVLFTAIMLTGCSQIPVAVTCPPFPSPPSVLMQPPPTQFLLDNALKPRSN